MSMKIFGVFLALVVIAKASTFPLYFSSPSTTYLRSPLLDTSVVTSENFNNNGAFAYSALTADAYSPFYSVFPSYRQIVYVQPEPRYVTVDPPTYVQEIGKSPVLTFGKPQVDADKPIDVESPADAPEKESVDEDTVSVESA